MPAPNARFEVGQYRIERVRDDASDHLVVYYDGKIIYDADVTALFDHEVMPFFFTLIEAVHGYAVDPNRQKYFNDDDHRRWIVVRCANATKRHNDTKGTLITFVS